MSAQLLSVKSTTTFTLAEILAMPQAVRKSRVTRAEANAHNLVFIDGAAGTAQFVGSREEHAQRMGGFTVRR